MFLQILTLAHCRCRYISYIYLYTHTHTLSLGPLSLHRHSALPSLTKTIPTNPPLTITQPVCAFKKMNNDCQELHQDFMLNPDVSLSLIFHLRREKKTLHIGGQLSICGGFILQGCEDGSSFSLTAFTLLYVHS